jgi:hypothetical protein
MHAENNASVLGRWLYLEEYAAVRRKVDTVAIGIRNEFRQWQKHGEPAVGNRVHSQRQQDLLRLQTTALRIRLKLEPYGSPGRSAGLAV